MNDVIVCCPATIVVRGVRRCPDCKRVGRWAGFDAFWYGIYATCLNCGRSWEAGEVLPLAFARGVRADAIAKARRRWAEAVRAFGPEHRAWRAQQMERVRE